MENTNDIEVPMRRIILKSLIFALLPVLLSIGAEASTIERSGKAGTHAIVFIPGLASHGDLWESWAKQYSVSNDVFVVTASGFAGEPAREGSEAFFQATVNEIISSLRTAKVADVTLVGHSIGGLMSLMIANEAPDLVRNVLVVDSLPFLAGLMMPGVSPEQAGQRAQYFAAQMKKMPREMYLEQQKQGVGVQSKTVSFLPTVLEWGAASDQATVATAFAEALGTDYRSNLKSITAQVTVLAAYDKQMPFGREKNKALYETQYVGLQNGRIEIIDNSFHFIMIDQPEAFSKALAAAVKEGM
ncbi:MAG: hypothetical protein COB37_03655 [Kordiimonadales bacterium]|nr:MAG: hypothetical protein COB37_03655 [Kordiimonadales bacterium]